MPLDLGPQRRGGRCIRELAFHRSKSTGSGSTRAFDQRSFREQVSDICSKSGHSGLAGADFVPCSKIGYG
jgi:hypothetical protein